MGAALRPTALFGQANFQTITFESLTAGAANLNPTFSTYAFGGKIVYSVPIQGLIVDAAQVAVGFTRFERRPIARHQSQLDEWHRDLGFWLTTAQLHAKAQYWPQNDKSCFLCHFKGICGRPPAGREAWLSKEFVRRTWDPLVARGDI